MAIRKAAKLPADASVFLAVNVPAKDDREYNAHANRAVRLLDQAGYEVNAMTGEFILQMADNIRAQMAHAQHTAAHIEAAAKGQTEQTGADDGTQ